MESHFFWFNDEQWAKIAPHPPTNQPGPCRNDDRLILSGIMHVLEGRLSLGGLPEGIWPAQDDLQSFRPLERAGHLAEDLRGRRISFRTTETSGVG
jgi:transposase